ncbi:protein-export chaperone SecB [Caldichromatium japonicum]|uniref:Protein-export protein SecB n=1 Tax=Caldichromatium japonicum TaxID=2699430 RepID=A0A6G7VAB8_9GAMM|nr:protein-export chaperone SecB [Caldichromatium japonicum]QIK36815.1 protein-export chaperone SecB [Caldichromatium japonicum]
MSTEHPFNERHFSIQRLYLKDLSFESPNAPDIFRGPWKPQHELTLNTRITALETSVYEVVLAVTATVKVEDKTAFLVEVQQAGIFVAQGFTEEELRPLLGAYCPALLFPYAREVISDLSTKGSFPPLILQHINFDVLFAQHQPQDAAESKDSPKAQG